MGNVIFYGKNMELFKKIQIKKYLVWASLFYKDKLYFWLFQKIAYIGSCHFIILCIIFPVIHWIKLLKTHPDWSQQSPKCLFPSLKQIWGFQWLKSPSHPQPHLLEFREDNFKGQKRDPFNFSLSCIYMREFSL